MFFESVSVLPSDKVVAGVVGAVVGDKVLALKAGEVDTLSCLHIRVECDVVADLRPLGDKSDGAVAVDVVAR